MLLAPPPHGRLVTRASTGFPFRHVIAGLNQRHAISRAKRSHLLLIPPVDGLRDRAIAFDQKRGGNVRQSIGVADRKARGLQIEKNRKSNSVALGELARLSRVILRDAVHGEPSRLTQSFEKRKRELAHRTRNLEKGQQYRTLRKNFRERFLAAFK